MIRINLLGDNTKIDYSSKLLVAGFGASIAACLVVFFLMHQAINSDVTDLSGQVDVLERNLTQLREKTKLVKELESKRDLLNSKIALIAKLKKSKIGPVRVMDDFNQAVPERVWIRQVTEREGKMEFHGRALDNQDIALFMRNLESSEYFSRVDLVESRQMYYSKVSGKVAPTPDLKRLKRSTFGGESRVTIKKSGQTAIDPNSRKKTSATSSSKNDKGGRRAVVDELNIKIKEFIVSAAVNYAGELKFSSVDDAREKLGIKKVKMRK